MVGRLDKQAEGRRWWGCRDQRDGNHQGALGLNGLLALVARRQGPVAAREPRRTKACRPLVRDLATGTGPTVRDLTTGRCSVASELTQSGPHCFVRILAVLLVLARNAGNAVLAGISDHRCDYPSRPGSPAQHWRTETRPVAHESACWCPGHHPPVLRQYVIWHLVVDQSGERT